VTLAMLAHAFLVVAALLQRIRHPPPPELIPLTWNEISHQFVGLAAGPSGPPAALVAVATPIPGARPYLPLPPPGDLGPMKITIYGWRTRPRAVRSRRPATGPQPRRSRGR
jgi:hypothetical protein